MLSIFAKFQNYQLLNYILPPDFQIIGCCRSQTANFLWNFFLHFTTFCWTMSAFREYISKVHVLVRFLKLLKNNNQIKHLWSFKMSVLSSFFPHQQFGSIISFKYRKQYFVALFFCRSVYIINIIVFLCNFIIW